MESVKIKDPNVFRAEVAASLREHFHAHTDPRKHIAENVEKSIYNFTVRRAEQINVVKSWDNRFFRIIYENRWRCIHINFMRLPSLLERINSGELSAAELSALTHIDMDAEHWQDKLDAKLKKDSSKFTFNEKASTDMFECRNCRSRRCQYYEMQVRSADESCSYFVTCLDCGKHWRVN